MRIKFCSTIFSIIFSVFASRLSVRVFGGLLVVCALAPLEAFAQSAEAGQIQAALATAAMPALTNTWVTKFYSDRAFQPVWTARGQLTYAAEQLKAALTAEVPANGLVLKDYLTPQLESYFAAPLTGSDWVNAELAFSKAFVEASIHMSIGRLDLKDLANSADPLTKQRFKDVKYERRAFSKWPDLQAAVSSEGFQSVWNRIAPQHKEYQNLKKVLASLRAVQASGGFKAISAPSMTLHLGSTGATVLALKTRAKFLGYQITNLDGNYDQEFRDIVIDIQNSNLADPTGVLASNDGPSWEAFGVTSERRITQVELNMEKLRWWPEVLEPKRIFVNLATQHLKVIDPTLTNPILLDMRVIVGQTGRKTPSMRDAVSDVILNPNWTVPSTVFAEDKVTHIRDLIAKQGMQGVTDYFTQGFFSVMNGDMTQTIPPESIDWINLDPKHADITIVQAPNYMNALGVAKIQLGNPWAIYMHDTNQRERFSESMRSLSSGCIRLQYPIDLAEYLLSGTGWDRAKIDATTAKPGDLPSKPTWIRPVQANRLPLYTLGLTAQVGDDGVTRFTRDIYQQNLYILEALQAAGFYSK
jgi:murein L,D-transpeptidase YcbB/YkuD